MTSPRKITLHKYGAPVIGYLTAPTVHALPFRVRHVFWTYFTPERVTRGRHAHKRTWIAIFALTGKITVHTEMPDGTKKSFTLDKPNIGLLVPPMVWHVQRYSHTAIQIALASLPYDEREYIRDYNVYKTLTKKKKR